MQHIVQVREVREITIKSTFMMHTLPKNKDFEPFKEGEGVFSTFCYKCAIS